ncbi:hypothetical protein BRADI_3g32583v3 [Brachypodium distachyon]|uniref:Uncharacterized protein n=1 Tax=Brachypodium distachyon TaxID=15368 RepID=A0A2K2D0M3_BRADI|nr:hypothetical protein BRADI_3g32583v3 [Brachypodium distachyon]
MTGGVVWEPDGDGLIRHRDGCTCRRWQLFFSFEAWWQL